jgi:hypothetical protein
MAVLYPAAESSPGAFWLAAPGGLRTRARLVAGDDADDRPAFTIDAVEKPVLSLPSVPVARQPEVIREHRVPTPVTDSFTGWVDATEVSSEAEKAAWYARTRLGAWEGMVERMTAGWPPDGWYPADYYREDLETRDELENDTRQVPAPVAERLTAALAEVDERFRSATAEADDDRVAAVVGLGDVDVALKGGWWWRRLPDPAPWPDAPRSR